MVLQREAERPLGPIQVDQDRYSRAGLQSGGEMLSSCSIFLINRRLSALQKEVVFAPRNFFWPQLKKQMCGSVSPKATKKWVSSRRREKKLKGIFSPLLGAFFCDIFC